MEQTYVPHYDMYVEHKVGTADFQASISGDNPELKCLEQMGRTDQPNYKWGCGKTDRVIQYCLSDNGSVKQPFGQVELSIHLITQYEEKSMCLPLDIPSSLSIFISSESDVRQLRFLK